MVETLVTLLKEKKIKDFVKKLSEYKYSNTQIPNILKIAKHLSEIYDDDKTLAVHILENSTKFDAISTEIGNSTNEINFTHDDFINALFCSIHFNSADTPINVDSTKNHLVFQHNLNKAFVDSKYLDQSSETIKKFLQNMKTDTKSPREIAKDYYIEYQSHNIEKYKKNIENLKDIITKSSKLFSLQKKEFSYFVIFALSVYLLKRATESTSIFIGVNNPITLKAITNPLALVGSLLILILYSKLTKLENISVTNHSDVNQMCH